MELNAETAPGIPLRLGAPADFAAVYSFLRDADFIESSITRRLGIRTIFSFQSIKDGRTTGTEMREAIDFLIRLFMDQDGLDLSLLKQYVPISAQQAMERLGLIFQHEGLVYGSVLLYQVEGMYVVSDCTTERPERPLGADVVYPAITDHSRFFLWLLPRSPCGTFLEGCGGTGAAALAATRFAGHSWTIDITLRSAWFAEFNKRLNHADNMTSLQGDMYAPVADRGFDRIVAHPPFVAASENQVIFRDGGVDGEELFRRAVLEGVPRLNDDGLLYVACVASDRKDGRMEERVRALLGSQGAGVDIILLTRFEQEPMEYRLRTLTRYRLPMQGFDGYRQHVDRFGIERVVASHLYLRKRRGTSPVQTLRRPITGPVTPEAALWQLDMEIALGHPAARDALWQQPLQATRNASMQVRYLQDAPGWLPADTTIETEWPFRTALRAPVWLADLVNRLDGTTRPAEVVASLRASGQLPAEVGDPVLGELISRLVLSGFLTANGLPAPPVPPLAESGEAVA